MMRWVSPGSAGPRGNSSDAGRDRRHARSSGFGCVPALVLAHLLCGCGPLVGIEDVRRAAPGEMAGELACVRCGGSCTALNTTEHCGACDHRCEAGEACVAGLCGRRMASGPGARLLCVRGAGGEQLCRGANDVGQLGRGTTSVAEPDWAPMLLPAEERQRTTFVAASETVACVRLTDGGLRCTGSNDTGGLGSARPGADGTLAAPTDLAAGFADLTAGPTTDVSSPVCAITETGAACWGFGDPAKTPRSVDVSALGGALFQIRAGAGFVCVLDTLGNLACLGTVGESKLTEGTVAAAFAAPRARLLAASATTACLVSTDNRVSCWGANELGERGVGTTSPRASSTPEPVTATFPSPVIQLVAGTGHFCALDEAGEVYCWGRASSAGDGHDEGLACANGTCRPLPELVPIHDVVELTVAGSVTVARRRDGAYFAWGESTAADCLLGDSCADVVWGQPTRLAVP
jgi:hypothetical protein